MSGHLSSDTGDATRRSIRGFRGMPPHNLHGARQEKTLSEEPVGRIAHLPLDFNPPTKRQPTRISESTALPLHPALLDGPQAAHATFLQNDAPTWCDGYESK